MRRPIVTDIKKTGRGEGIPSILRGVVIDTRVATGMCRVRLDNLSKRTIKNVIIPVGENLQSGDVVLLANLGQDPRWVIITKMQEGSDIGQHLSPTDQGTTQLHPPNNLSVTGIDGAVKAEWDCWAGNTVCWDVQHNTSATETGASTRYTRGAYFFYFSSTAVTRYIRVRAVRYDVELNQAYYSGWSAWDSATSTVPDAGDADTVDGFHASDTPVAGWLLALDSNAQWPSEVVPSMLGAHTLGGHTDRTAFESDGTITFEGNATIWDDLRFPVQAINPPGAASDPDRDTGDGTFLFDNGSTEILMGIAQMPHSWKLESNINPHIHWCPTNTDTGDVRWRFEYDIAKVNGTFAGAYTSIDVDDAGDGTAEKHQRAYFAAVSMTGYDTISAIIKWKISRIGGSDTYNADARLLEFDIHYEMDTIGSREELSK